MKKEITDLQRTRNRLAAQKSRQAQRQKLVDLQERCRCLELRVLRLEDENAQLHQDLQYMNTQSTCLFSQPSVDSGLSLDVIVQSEDTVQSCSEQTAQTPSDAKELTFINEIFWTA